jgi:lipopolysaccharide export system permease protein
LGSPLIFSIAFFMVFYFLGTTGEKFAKEGAWQPMYGMWLSTFVLVPIGIFLTYKALRDSFCSAKNFIPHRPPAARRFRKDGGKRLHLRNFI